MTDNLVGRLRRYGDPMHVEAAARIEALEAENRAAGRNLYHMQEASAAIVAESRAVRMMLADLHAATLTIATPKGSQLDEARDAAAAHFQDRNLPHAD